MFSTNHCDMQSEIIIECMHVLNVFSQLLKFVIDYSNRGISMPVVIVTIKG